MLVFDRYRNPSALPYRVVHLSRSEAPQYPCDASPDPNGWDKPLFAAFGQDPQPWTWRRLFNTYAWIREGSAPIGISIDRDGGLLEINTMSNILNKVGTDPIETQVIYNTIDGTTDVDVDSLLLSAVKKHNEGVAKQLSYDKAMKELELVSRLVTAIPELKDTPAIQSLLSSHTQLLSQDTSSLLPPQEEN